MAPPMFGPYLDLVDNAETLTLTMDLSSKNLLTAIAMGKDEKQSEELREGLDSLMGMGKMALQSSGMPANEPVFQPVVESMKADRKGKEVKIEIVRPEGLLQMVEESLKQVRQAAKRAERMNNFRQLGLAILNYDSAYRKLPFHAINDTSDEISWRIRVLPFLDEVQIYDQMDLKKGPAEEPNVSFADKMPTLLGIDRKNAQVTAIKLDKPLTSFNEITDGSINTIALLEYPKGKPWMENNPITIDEAVELVLNLKADELLIAVFYDGSAISIDNQIGEENLRNLLDPRDGNEVNRRGFWRPLTSIFC